MAENKLKIVDVSGKLILRVHLGQGTIGKHKIEIAQATNGDVIVHFTEANKYYAATMRSVIECVADFHEAQTKTGQPAKGGKK